MSLASLFPWLKTTTKTTQKSFWWLACGTKIAIWVCIMCFILWRMGGDLAFHLGSSFNNLTVPTSHERQKEMVLGLRDEKHNHATSWRWKSQEMGHEAETRCQNQTKEIEASFSTSQGISLQNALNSALNTNLDLNEACGEVIHPWHWLPTAFLDQGFERGSHGVQLWGGRAMSTPWKGLEESPSMWLLQMVPKTYQVLYNFQVLLWYFCDRIMGNTNSATIFINCRLSWFTFLLSSKFHDFFPKRVKFKKFLSR